MLSTYLVIKEIWRNKGRFVLISLVIALITTLVLFIAALAEGLGSGNKEYIEKLNAELIVFQQDTDFSITASRVGRSKLNDLRRVEGVRAVGPIGFSSAAIVFEAGREALDISLIGAEPGLPGEPPAFAGRGLRGSRAKEAIIDRYAALQTGLQVGDTFTLKSIQGTEEKYYSLRVAGITDGRQYFIRPSIVVPYLTWDKIRPKAGFDNGAELTANIVGVQLDRPADIETVRQRLEAQVGGIQVTDPVTAYKAAPGYTAQQSTLNTQKGFTLLIGLLVIGGFFQIQTLQKTPQIGMLKAIGASNLTVAAAAIAQIILVTILGVLIGSAGTLALSLALPPVIPIIFSRAAVAATMLTLMLTGPIGGLVSVRLALKVEPLTALGLSA